ncbi:MAG: DNA/RNA non-specific endonuclease [Firmicutes bacterium]|nr:DNA/RNA non-specific endonuclease [Bacillota bacterium]
MRNFEYSSVDPKTGNVTWEGPLSIEKGDHTNMPSRTEAYLPGDERGHVNASSLGGNNSRANVVPQNSDVNHGGYLSVENGERSALQSGASIESKKTAVVEEQPGDRPSSFSVNDTVTYPDGHTEAIHNSFTNESYASQEAWNETSAALPGIFDGPNPGDGLRDSMTPDAYAGLMEETDAALPNIADDYAPADFSGVPDSTDLGGSITTETDVGDTGATADFGGDDGPSTDVSPDTD